MAKRTFSVHIDNAPLADDSHLVLCKFPAMRSQTDNPPDSIQISLKPKSLKLKMTVSLNKNSPNFDTDKAYMLASKSIPKTFTDTSVDKNFYSSTKVTAGDDQLFVARVVDDKIICRPIAHYLTMRSDFKHFDVKEESDIKEEVKPVSVKFAGPDRANSTYRSQSDLQQQIDESFDEELQLTYHHVDSVQAIAQRQILFGDLETRIKPDPDASCLSEVDQKPTLLALIEPKVERMDIDDPGHFEIKPDPDSPRKSLMSQATKDLVKQCLKKAKIVSFDEVVKYIRENSAKTYSANRNLTKDILDGLTEFAVLVQGNWAIKSEILYRDQSQTNQETTDVTGISLSLFISAREYLLWQFTQDRVISRPVYTEQVKLPDHDVLVLLKQLAEFRKDIRRWEFKLSTDDNFISQNPDIVQRQNSLWKVRKANKLSMFSV